jgi:hypothetical protein
MKLYFDRPSFHEGVNLSIRRGVKWATKIHEHVLAYDSKDELHGGEPIFYCEIVDQKVMKFVDIPKDDFKIIHDKDNQSYEKMLEEMKRIYGDFSEHEIVTLLYFKRRDEVYDKIPYE